MSAGAATIVAATSTACQNSPGTDRQLVFASLRDALQEIDRLAAAPALKSSAVWSWPQTLTHCAQSIDYSMTGFPQPKSALFQHTVGALAIQVFSWRGRMSHDLAEPIPGAASLEPSPTPEVALAHIRQSVQDFMAYRQALKPHFAYGELDHGAYEKAHAMHLANHLSGFDIQA